MDLVALRDRCEEASPLSQEKYIPCNAPAAFIVDNGDARTYRMCHHCADHNVRNRRAKIVGPYTPTSERTPA